MKRILGVLAIPLSVAAVCWVFRVEAAPPTLVVDDGAVDNMAPAALSGVQPVDVNSDKLPMDDDGIAFTFTSLQPRFDRFSWETFVALNCPAKLDGTKETEEKIGAVKDNLAIWELWKEDYEIFLDHGDVPSAWGAKRRAPSYFSRACRDLFELKQAELAKVGRPLAVLEAFVEPFDTGPLIDQMGQYARFEILVNKDMFKYIVDNGLYSKASQAQHAGHVVFTCGSKLGDKPEIQGSIMIKAAWKVLSPQEIRAGRFHTADCLVYTRENEEFNIKENCKFVTMGLVGFHVVHKTFTRPQWVWSTFEHVDNCPTVGHEGERPSYSFYSRAQHPGLLATNSPPLPPWNPTVTEPSERRSQTERVQPVTQIADDQNRAFQKLLQGSVWANYRLISTQWPSQVDGKNHNCDPQEAIPADLIALPAPQFLGSSMLESYIPRRTVNASSSCIECHANATTTATKFSDFTFLLLRAK